VSGHETAPEPPVRVLVTALFMIALASLASLAGGLLSDPVCPLTGVIRAALLPAGATVGTAAGARKVGALWPDLVCGALVAGLVLIPLSGWVTQDLSPWELGYYPGMGVDQVKAFFVFALLVVSGTFLLPLVDCQVWRAGPAPSWRTGLPPPGPCPEATGYWAW